MSGVPSLCPTCANVLRPRELECLACRTTVRGFWDPSPLGKLTADQHAFLILFVRSRGNLSEIERALGVSYPTVRAKLEELIDALDDELATPVEEPDTAGEERRRVLESVARGELSPSEALENLRRGRRSEQNDG